jgi:peptidoglycan/LPS O-acetylase OafA/YrhL
VLPSVFAHNPFPSANGSLWSLPLEVLAYVLLATGAVHGALRSRRVLAACVAAVACASAAAPNSWGLRLIGLFFGAVALYVWRDRVALRSDVAAILTLLWIGSFTTRFSATVGVVALPYLVTFLAYRSPRCLRRLAARGDVSYGVYVYSFPVQQSLVAALGAINPLLLFSAAAPIVWLIGLASWKLVEAPALARKPRGPRMERTGPEAPSQIRPAPAAAAAGSS